MNTFTHLFSALAVGALLSLGLIAVPATAQDKAKATKAAPAKAEKGATKITPLLENDKVKVYETLYRPGDENKAVATTAYRILRVLKGGTITRTYADGKTEKVEFKTGDVKFLEPFKTAYVSKNEGKSDIQFYVVQLK